MSIQQASSYTHSNFSRWKYDVFLSFRGEDTRKGFTDHLFVALNQKGIKVFRDNEKLEMGKAISPGLSKAIEESRSSIIVFSRNYAHSTWCLDELVKIVQCKKTTEHMIFPIFYDVEPTMVRKQEGKFQGAFAKHEKTFGENVEKVEKWRKALREVTGLKGWHLEDRPEADFIKEIVKDILITLKPITLRTFDDLIGINSRVEKLRVHIDLGSSDVRMIGIFGMGGIGKTTIARVVYDLICSEFEGSSFLANVREISEKKGLIALQEQLLSEVLLETNIKIYNDLDGIKMMKGKLQHKKVLIVIDDVVHLNQLNKLAGKHFWFGSGSRIIITTRDKHLLITHRVDEVYEVEPLKYHEALQLFTLKAFDNNQPYEEYMCLTNHFVRYADGLPLALGVLGSFLFGRHVDEWRSTLERLSRNSENEILDILQISFDGLKETEKKIFLDIACFFKGKGKDYVTKILNGCGFDPIIGIGVLVSKSLLTILHNNILWMHDLLQEMGQQIVKRKSPEEPGKRNRLWKAADVHHMLTKNTGTEGVEGIVLGDLEFLEGVHYIADAKAFSKMTKLRLLKIHNVQLPEGLESLSNELRLLDWHGYPLKSLPSSLQLENTVILNMCCSCIEQMWDGLKALKLLRIMILRRSKNLVRTPDFTWVPNLEELILEECTSLHEIHPSLLVHRKLILLNLKNCTSLTTLPTKISMQSLRKLVFSGCSKLKKIPEIVGSVECLSELLLDGTAVEELPTSIELLFGLVLLNMKDCKNLKSLPGTISALKCLETLNLSGCSKMKKFPEIRGNMECLSQLLLDGTAIEELPLSFQHLTGLQLLNLSDCVNLARLPSNISDLKCLKTLTLSGCSKLEYLQENLGQLEHLEELDVNGTALTQMVSSFILLKNLKVLTFCKCKRLPSSSQYRHFSINLMPERSSEPRALMLPSLSDLHSLKELDLSDSNLGEGAILTKKFLEKLNASGNNFVSLPETMNHHSKLTTDIKSGDWKRFPALPELPSKISEVRVDGCTMPETSSDAFRLRKSEKRLIGCLNCLKLLSNNDLMYSMLKGFLEAESNQRNVFSIFFPGCQIPGWFSSQNEGSSITIIRPPENLYNRKLMGYAFGSVFSVHKHPTTLRSSPFPVTRKFRCRMTAYKIESSCAFDNMKSGNILFEAQFLQSMSDHLWLLYSADKMLQDIECNFMEFSFESEEDSELEVKVCAVHPVYAREVEEFNETTNQWCSSSVSNLNKFYQDLVGSSLVVASASNQSLADYVATEAIASGCPDEEPQTKTFIYEL